MAADVYPLILVVGCDEFKEAVTEAYGDAPIEWVTEHPQVSLNKTYYAEDDIDAVLASFGHGKKAGDTIRIQTHGRVDRTPMVVCTEGVTYEELPLIVRAIADETTNGLDTAVSMVYQLARSGDDGRRRAVGD